MNKTASEKKKGNKNTVNYGDRIKNAEKKVQQTASSLSTTAKISCQVQKCCKKVYGHISVKKAKRLSNLGYLKRLCLRLLL